jgi:hypothetical protein
VTPGWFENIKFIEAPYHQTCGALAEVDPALFAKTRIVSKGLIIDSLLSPFIYSASRAFSDISLP